MKTTLRWIFVGTNGIRAGWRLAIFVAIFAALNAAVLLVLRLTHTHPMQSGAIQPVVTLLAEGITFVFALFAAWVMSKIERRPFGAYGLAWRDLLRNRFWMGLVSGFAAISLVLLLTFALHGFAITGIATAGNALMAGLALWIPVFIAVALLEEFLLRGYAQYTLTTGMGFWPAAVVLSLAFAALHIHNTGENALGIGSAVAFAMVMCLALRQTGNLWLGIGIHAGWDWGESFFYGVPDSGTTIKGAFLNSTFHGPLWLTGGSDGPEGSVITLIVLAMVAGIILWRYPKAVYTTRLATAA
jgi:uncharacterized protein